MLNSSKYITVMFPYPSGSGLHIGHWYNYAIVDSYCNLQRYLGYEVYQPFGYDSFGLPTENYARLYGRDPLKVTEENIINFNEEIERMNTSFVYKLSTHSLSYQKHTKDIFKMLLDHDLAYKAKREQDYCPSCETVLAKEQVKDYKCDRCSTLVTKKELEQWFFRITSYKQRLIDDLAKVDYPEKTKKQQLHWLENLTDWCVSRQRKWGCPIPIEGEIDTLDTFVDSSFYTMIYDNDRPVDVYVGGNEHACAHLIYARFICKFLYDIKKITFDEPFLQVIHQGMILGPNGEKMSKSKGNIIDPTIYHPQSLRMYLMFINHYFDGGKWIDNGYKGCEKFIKRFNTWLEKSEASIENNRNDLDLESFKQKVIGYMLAWKTNKVVSEWMIFYNDNKKAILKYSQVEELREFFNIFFPYAKSK